MSLSIRTQTCVSSNNQSIDQWRPTNNGSDRRQAFEHLIVIRLALGALHATEPTRGKGVGANHGARYRSVSWWWWWCSVRSCPVQYCRARGWWYRLGQKDNENASSPKERIFLLAVEKTVAMSLVAHSLAHSHTHQRRQTETRRKARALEFVFAEERRKFEATKRYIKRKAAEETGRDSSVSECVRAGVLPGVATCLLASCGHRRRD